MDRLAHESAYLIALDASLSNREYPLHSDHFLIGRDGTNCDIVAAGETISRQHARLESHGANKHRLIDLNSTNGLFVNGNRVQNNTLLNDNDVISLGSKDIFHLRYQHTSNKHKSWNSTLPAEESWSIGRDSGCDISLPFEAVVSSCHAILKKVRNNLVLTDLHSLNGTWLNGSRVKKSQILPEDTVVIGATYFHFTLLEDGRLEVNRRDCGDEIQLECVNLSYEVKKKNGQSHVILDDITLSLKPGEFVGILGPSGAGKSTLLKAFNGYQPPSSGSVLLNTAPLYQTYQMFRNTIGYVPQDDILHQELSVVKSLEYIAKLRLPKDLSTTERNNIVESTIEALGLSHVRDHHIVHLSGGQRKRVSIGAELLTKPGILFLDEPTAGLDPSVEERIMHHFKKMTRNGTTILITTHILYSLDLLDRVIILSQGKLVFFGKPREALKFFNTDSHKVERTTQLFDILSHVSRTGQTEANQNGFQQKKDIANYYKTLYAESSYSEQHVASNQTKVAKQYAQDYKLDKTAIQKKTTTQRKSLLGGIFPWQDTLILTARQVRLRIGSGKRALLYAIIPVLLALVTMSQQVPGLEDDQHFLSQRDEYAGNLKTIPPQIDVQLTSLLSPKGDNESRSLSEVIFSLKHEGVQNLPLPMSVMLMCIMTAVFLGTINTCLEISTEKSIYQRERMSSLRITDYLFSKLPLVFLVTMLQITLFLLLLYLHPAFRSTPLLATWPVLVAVAWNSAILGLFISTLDPTRGQLSVIFAIAAVLPQLILSGGLGPDYYQGLNKSAQYIADCLPAKWGLEMLFTSLYNDLHTVSTGWINTFVLDDIGFHYGENVITKAMIILLGQSFMWLILSAWILKRKDTIKL